MLQKSSMQRTLEIFYREPTKTHHLMNISKDTKIAHTSIKKNLKELTKQSIINELIEKKGSRKFPYYEANLENTEFKRLKMLYNLSLIFESGIIEFIDDELAPKTIILFGSFRRGEDTEDSDIDLFIECKREIFDLSLYEKKIGRKIELHFNEDFASYSKELKNNILNGIVLIGFLEGFK